MTTAAAPSVRTVTFGDLESALWGAMVAGEAPFLALGAGDQAQVPGPFAVEGGSDAEEWRISADGAELVVSGDGDSVSLGADGGFVQLCRVTGRIAVGGETRELECEGVRTTRAAPAPDGLGSLRDVSAWFERDEGVSALAVRPRKTSGHADDDVSVAVIDADGPLTIADPRLSTTYAAGGTPTRMSLELWIGPEESEQYPRRIAGEASAPAVRAALDGLEIVAAPLRCHSRGRDGAGVYLLARRA